MAYTWHKVSKKDQKRITCSDTLGPVPCTKPAKHCQHVTGKPLIGIAFYYYCDEHAHTREDVQP